MIYLCPDCQGKIDYLPAIDAVKCSKCEYTAPDTYFCELVHNLPKGR